MTKRIPEPRAELSPGIRDHEARLLATMVRTSRLTCVFGEPGTEKSALLKGGVMPLLQRRASDRRAFGGAAPGAHAGAERRARRPGPAARPSIEAAIYFDTWGGDPLAELLARVDGVAAVLGPHEGTASSHLHATLHALHRALGLRIVFLLDRFEEFLARPADQDESARFTSALVDAVLDPGLPASFLIALDEPFRPRLERFRARIPGFDHNSLRLSPIAEPTEVDPTEPPSADEPVASAIGAPGPTAPVPPRRIVPPPRPKHLRGPPPRAPVNVDDVYALIEQTLTRTSARRPFVAPGASLGGDPRIRPPAAEAARRPTPAAEAPAAPPQAIARGSIVGAPASEPDSRPAAAFDLDNQAAQKAVGTFRLAAALGRLRHRRTGGA